MVKFNSFIWTQVPLNISRDPYLNLTTFPRRLNVRSGHPQDDEWPAEKLWMEVLEGARVGVTEKKEAEGNMAPADISL